MDRDTILVGQRVIYIPYEGCPPGQKEEGVVTSIGTRYVFVQYGDDHHSKATNPEDLEDYYAHTNGN